MRRDAHVSRVLGMGHVQTRECLCHCNRRAPPVFNEKALAPPPPPPLGAIAHVVIIIEE